MTRKFIPVEEVAKEWFKDPEFRAAYDALEEEFALASALIEARARAGLTQEAAGEGVVPRGVADEARGELHGLVEEERQVVDQVIWEADAAEEL